VPQTAQATLQRRIGRWSLTFLIINSVVGSGIFGLPSVFASLTGSLSPWLVLLAALAVGIIIACFAEVASRFTQAGGPYLYARAAFGRLIGIQTGWMLWLAQLAAVAANANLFVMYLAEFWPSAMQPLLRILILTGLIGMMVLINIRGIKAGTELSNVLTIVKLTPLAVVIIGGAWYLAIKGSPHLVLAGAHQWRKTMLLLFFLYGGFETALAPMSEAKDPRRDTVFGLFAALVSCAVIYTLVQWIVIATLPGAAQSQRPLSDVAGLFLGHSGSAMIAIGALVSVYGYLSAKILAVPRITYALAEQHDFPATFAAVHTRFHTPYISILVFGLLVWLLAGLESFAWNVTLSAVARLFYYAVGCAALPVLRRKQPGRAAFHLKAGVIFAMAGIAICLVLMSALDLTGSLVVVLTILIALANWLWARRHKAIDLSLA
jgi:APA family basic amino acid/polyamine antiporter